MLNKKLLIFTPKKVKLFLMKTHSLFIVIALLLWAFLAAPAACFAQEQITITTYYPAPYGIYREIRTDQLAIGTAYRTSALADGSLIVSGNTGLGTPTPSQRLDVNGAIRWGTSRGLLTTDQGSSMEIGGSGTPYIDFSNDTVSDFDVRLILTGNDTLEVQGGSFVILTGTSARTYDPRNAAPYAPVLRYRNKSHDNAPLGDDVTGGATVNSEITYP